jgi:PAS domain S-box-containing protein
MHNKLLKRQVQKHFGVDKVPENLRDFLETINSSYEHYEQDRVMLERSIEISSEEMIELNQSQMKSHEELKTLFENIEEVFFSVKFPEIHLLQISPACLKIYGYSKEDFIANPQLWYVLILDEDKKIIDANYQEMYAGNSFRQEYRIQNRGGDLRWLETKITPTLDKEKKLIRIDGTTSDITERKNAEQAMAVSENKYRDLFEKMVDGVYKSSHEGKFIEVNLALVNMLGYDSKEELLAIDIKSQLYFNPDDRVEAVYQDRIDGISTFLLKKKDGSPIWVEDRGQYVSDINGIILYHEGILRDVSERVKAQEAIMIANDNLRISIDRLTEAQQIAHLGSWILDVKTNAILRSPEFYKIFDSSLSEFPNTLEEYLNFFHPDDRNIVRDTFNQATKDHQPYQYEARLVMKDGTIKNIFSNGKSIENEKGDLIKMHGTIQDVTQQKSSELELEKNIVELKKSNSELDKFVYSVSHDLRAPLSSMLGVVEITEEETQDKLVLEHMSMLKGSIKRLDGFIADILSYSRNSRLDIIREEINFKEMIDDIKGHLKYMSGFNRKVDITVDINNEKRFLSDKNRINMVLNNIISNAIRYQNQAINDPFVNVKIDMSDTETNIIVKDNGIGISKENIDKIFEMFYRVSENSIGSGLGLYIVKETIQKLKGVINVESEPGIGTTFQLSIPNLINSNNVSSTHVH